MKKFAFLIMAAMCFSSLSLTGCGSGEPTVVEAPAETEEDAAMEGISDEDYDAAMDADEGN